jgi:hypothetical protein
VLGFSPSGDPIELDGTVVVGPELGFETYPYADPVTGEVRLVRGFDDDSYPSAEGVIELDGTVTPSAPPDVKGPTGHTFVLPPGEKSPEGFGGLPTQLPSYKYKDLVTGEMRVVRGFDPATRAAVELNGTITPPPGAGFQSNHIDYGTGVVTATPSASPPGTSHKIDYRSEDGSPVLQEGTEFGPFLRNLPSDFTGGTRTLEDGTVITSEVNQTSAAYSSLAAERSPEDEPTTPPPDGGTAPPPEDTTTPPPEDTTTPPPPPEAETTPPPAAEEPPLVEEAPPPVEEPVAEQAPPPVVDEPVAEEPVYEEPPPPVEEPVPEYEPPAYEESAPVVEPTPNPGMADPAVSDPALAEEPPPADDYGEGSY